MERAIKIFFIILFFCIAGGVWLYYSDFQQQQALALQLDSVSIDIAHYYMETLEDHAFPLKEEDLSANQMEHLKTLQKFHDDLLQVEGTGNRVHTVSKLQMVAWKFLRSVEDEDDVLQSEAYQAFRESMGERGKVRKTLQNYNDLAKQWNVMSENAVVSIWTAQVVKEVSNDAYEHLPYLRFDGELDGVQEVSL